MIVKFRFRRDTAANWTAANPILALGEPGLETDTRRVKYGDGTTPWASLAYAGAEKANLSGAAFTGAISVDGSVSIKSLSLRDAGGFVYRISGGAPNGNINQFQVFNGASDNSWTVFNADGSHSTGITSGGLVVDGNKVVGARATGWGAATGTAERGTFATYNAPTISNPPTQAEVQALANALQTVSRQLKALRDDLATHGLIAP